MDYAVLTDNKGRKADCRHVILIMTSNAGARTYYTQYVNYNCQLIMQYARSEWAKSPDAEGASKAFDWLVFIEPGSSCEGEAKALYNEIKQKVTSDWNFENREKYKAGEPFCISAATGSGTGDLLDEILNKMVLFLVSRL